MKMDRILALVGLASLSWYRMSETAQVFGIVDNQKFSTVNENMDIPSGLLIGAGISSPQHEGAFKISDRTESFLDHKYRERPPAANFYYKYREDIELLKNIGFDTFRFSISWTRLLPNGTSDYISEDGLRFYNNVLDELKKRGIKPFVTIYHWDHPQKFEDEGGWTNESMVYLFANYSRVVFEKFGNRVNYFGTINEPEAYCKYFSVLNGTPESKEQYQCHHNMLKAHALAYHIYDKEFRHLQNGQVGIITLCYSFYPYSKDKKYLEAVAHDFDCGWTVHPIFSEKGDYPEIMKTNIAERSRLRGYNQSRLPEFSKEWIDRIKNSSDFFGLNHYSSWRVKRSDGNTSSWQYDSGIDQSPDPEWARTGTGDFYVVPQGFGDILRKIKDEYNNVPVYVLENGVAFKKTIDDDFRRKFFYSYMKEMLVAITRDKCNVRMYSLWSLIDGFEWKESDENEYTLGIVQVDFNNTNRKRTPKKSASWFKAILKSRKLLPPGNY